MTMNKTAPTITNIHEARSESQIFRELDNAVKKAVKELSRLYDGDLEQAREVVGDHLFNMDLT